MTDREKFEAWLTNGASDLSKMLLVDKFDGGGYSNNMARIQWEAWQAALASQQPRDHDWIEWKGGECPVGKDVLTEIRLRNGGHGTGEGGYFAWSQDENEYDIIAYRVVKP